MIGHYHKMVHDHARMMLRYFQNTLHSNLSQIIAVSCVSKNTSLMMRTDGNEIIIWCGVIVGFQSWMFTFWISFEIVWVIHISYSFLLHYCPAGAGPCPTDLNYLTKEVLRGQLQASPGCRTAAAAFSSHLMEPFSGLGRLCQGSMQMNLGIPGLDHSRV